MPYINKSGHESNRNIRNENITTKTTRNRSLKSWLCDRAGLVSQVTLAAFATSWYICLLDVSLNHASPHSGNIYACHPPLPPIPQALRSPPSGPLFTSAAEMLDALLSLKASTPEMDSISLAVVAPPGTIFSKSYGALKANETTPEKRGRPDENSRYRIASISKMFTVFELLVLKEKGLVGWDDSVSKYLKKFTYNQHGWGAYISEGQPQAS
ncbi:hypothetical protein FRC05_009828, partial [Tulasnella sp. 425]